MPANCTRLVLGHLFCHLPRPKVSPQEWPLTSSTQSPLYNWLVCIGRHRLMDSLVPWLADSFTNSQEFWNWGIKSIAEAKALWGSTSNAEACKEGEQKACKQERCMGTPGEAMGSGERVKRCQGYGTSVHEPPSCGFLSEQACCFFLSLHSVISYSILFWKFSNLKLKQNKPIHPSPRLISS